MHVQRIAWEAIKQGYQEDENQISAETILNVIMPDFRLSLWHQSPWSFGKLSTTFGNKP